MTVTVRFDRDDDEVTFLLASREESGSPIDVYSPRSPLGSAISGKKVGETATYTLPNGRAATVEILEAVPYVGVCTADDPGGRLVVVQPPLPDHGDCSAALSPRLRPSSACWLGASAAGARPRSGTSLMNQASTKSEQRAGSAQMKTPWIACVMA